MRSEASAQTQQHHSAHERKRETKTERGGREKGQSVMISAGYLKTLLTGIFFADTPLPS
jgi:hypothetical protein